MKYAFILGSNAFVTPHGAITYSSDDEIKSFLSIRSIYLTNAADSHLSINAEIKDMHGRLLRIDNNVAQRDTDFNVKTDLDQVLVTDANGTTVLDVHQLDEESAMALEHNISAELEVNMPFTAIRIHGNFMLEGMHIEIDNEKLFINGNSIGNSVLAGQNNLQFVPSNVII